MHDRDSEWLGRVSAELAAMVRAVSPALASVRLGPDGRASGFLWRPGLIVTSAPAARTVREITVALPGGAVVGAERVGAAEPSGVAAFRLTGGCRPATSVPPAAEPAGVGALVLSLGAAADASPTARLRLVRRVGANGALLDGPVDPGETGGPVLDAAGRLLGMGLAAPDGGCVLLPWAAIARAVESAGQGWLGVAFRPTVVPAPLRARTGQGSARSVVRLAPGGPAEAAGLRVGDIVLALDGLCMSGTGALRGSLAAARPGRKVQARVVRAGRIETVALIVGVMPAPA